MFIIEMLKVFKGMSFLLLGFMIILVFCKFIILGILGLYILVFSSFIFWFRFVKVMFKFMLVVFLFILFLFEFIIIICLMFLVKFLVVGFGVWGFGGVLIFKFKVFMFIFCIVLEIFLFKILFVSLEFEGIFIKSFNWLLCKVMFLIKLKLIIFFLKLG